jgi:hypothetical protein
VATVEKLKAMMSASETTGITREDLVLSAMFFLGELEISTPSLFLSLK